MVTLNGKHFRSFMNVLVSGRFERMPRPRNLHSKSGLSCCEAFEVNQPLCYMTVRCRLRIIDDKTTSVKLHRFKRFLSLLKELTESEALFAK